MWAVGDQAADGPRADVPTPIRCVLPGSRNREVISLGRSSEPFCPDKLWKAWRAKRWSSSWWNSAPGVVPKHYHPGPEFLYVLEGTLAHEPAGGPPRMLKTGAFAFDPDKGVHRISSPSTTARARVLGFLVLEKGQPLLFPVQ